jgi:hypothetical protein
MLIKTTIDTLIQQSEEHGVLAWLFRFSYSGVRFRGVFFSRSQTILLGVEAKNVAWQLAVSEEGNISGWIPKEVFPSLLGVLPRVDGKLTTAPLFSALGEALDRLAISETKEQAKETDILHLLGECRTKDSRYGVDGELPYFFHWRRVKPSKEARNKIQDHFGREVREVCYRNKVTAVWSAIPRDASLCFLDSIKAIQEIERLGKGNLPN